MIARDGYVNEDGDFVAMARITGLARENITQASVGSDADAITLVVNEIDVDGDAIEETLAETNVAKASAVFDALQTDARWTKDDTGYNFRYTVPASAVPDGGADYAVEFTFTMSGGETVQVPFVVRARKLARS